MSGKGFAEFRVVYVTEIYDGVIKHGIKNFLKNLLVFFFFVAGRGRLVYDIPVPLSHVYRGEGGKKTRGPLISFESVPFDFVAR